MFVEYNSLPDTARVWIYQSDRVFTAEEVVFIEEKSVEFINSWTRHGDDLKGSFTLKYNQFLVLAIDEDFMQASGCSIDASVRFVKGLEELLAVDLMNKLNITFKDGQNINMVSLSDFQKFAKAGKITSETVVFNNMLQTKAELESKWEVPAKESWHNRFVS